MGARRGLLAEELPFLWVGVEVKGTLTPPSGTVGISSVRMPSDVQVAWSCLTLCDPPD